MPVMPGLPGATTTWFESERAAASACSRPPLPTTQTFTRRPVTSRSPFAQPHDLLAAGADAHEGDGGAGLRGQEVDIVAGFAR